MPAVFFAPFFGVTLMVSLRAPVAAGLNVAVHFVPFSVATVLEPSSRAIDVTVLLSVFAVRLAAEDERDLDLPDRRAPMCGRGGPGT